MKLHNFNTFKTEAIFESKSLEDYEKEGYVTSDKFKTDEELHDSIYENATKDFPRFCQANKIPIVNPVLDFSENPNSNWHITMTMKSDHLSKENFVDVKNIGIFRNIFKHVWFGFSNTPTIISESPRDINGNHVLVFKPFLIADLVIKTEGHSLGGGGTFQYPVEFDHPSEIISQRSHTIFYDVINGKWLKYSERWAKELGHQVSPQLVKTNKNSGIFEA